MRILIADDINVSRLELEALLTRHGHEVESVSDGTEAWEILQGENPPRLVILDWLMDQMDGIEVCRLVRGRSDLRGVYLILLTSRKDQEHVLTGLEAGANDYVTKPYNRDELLARIRVGENMIGLQAELAARVSELAALASTDELTGTSNRRTWEETAKVEHERAIRYKREYGILMLDVDHFKALNDTQGHRAGDVALRKIGRAISSLCRSADVVGRYGGEEFVVLLPETNLAGLVVLAARIRERIWSLNIQHPSSPPGRVTISIGLAQGDGSPLETIVQRADAALYRAKRGGRNQVSGGESMPVSSLEILVTGGSTVCSASAKTFNHVRATVLIADDDPGTRKVYRTSLGQDDYCIVEAADGQAAIVESLIHEPDVIIIDVVMPGIGGIESVRTLKADPRTCNIPIIVISARDTPEDVLVGMEAGADEYLTKPIQSSALAARVRSMVRWSRQRKDLMHSHGLRAEQVRALSTLVDACRAIGAALTIETVLEIACATVAQTTGSTRVSAMLPDSEGKQLTIVRSVGINDDIIAKVRVPVGRGIAGKVFETGKPVIVNTKIDATHSNPFYDSDFFASVPFVSAPFGSGNEILGVLNVTDHTGGAPFTAGQLEYVTLIASIAGSALQTLLHRQSRDDARDLIVVALARLAEHRDNETARHVERVCAYSRILAQALRHVDGYGSVIDDRFVQSLSRAVPLHDIGKVAIPDFILRKPGRLTVAEMQMMRTHASIGAETIRSVVAKLPGIDFLNMAVEVIQSHHEWFDGSGYAQGLWGGGIPLSARIVALADVYDAMTTNRVYKRAVCHEDAVNTIKKLCGSQFDPAVVGVFMERQEEIKKLAAELSDRVESHSYQDVPVEGAFQESHVGAE